MDKPRRVRIESLYFPVESWDENFYKLGPAPENFYALWEPLKLGTVLEIVSTLEEESSEN